MSTGKIKLKRQKKNILKKKKNQLAKKFIVHINRYTYISHCEIKPKNN